jgi:hypothetical protein
VEQYLFYAAGRISFVIPPVSNFFFNLIRFQLDVIIASKTSKTPTKLKNENQIIITGGLIIAAIIIPMPIIKLTAT